MLRWACRSASHSSRTDRANLDLYLRHTERKTEREKYCLRSYSVHGESRSTHWLEELVVWFGYISGTPTKRQVSKRQVSKRPVSKRLKRQVYKTSGLQNVRFTKCQVYKTSGLQNVWLKKNIHIYSVLVVGGNPQVLLQPCMQAK
jgi:hypothetical protein